MEPTDREVDVLEKYSTPGLKRNELTRYGKRIQLEAQKLPSQRVTEILDELYGKEPDAKSEPTPK